MYSNAIDCILYICEGFVSSPSSSGVQNSRPSPRTPRSSAGGPKWKPCWSFPPWQPQKREHWGRSKIELEVNVLQKSDLKTRQSGFVGGGISAFLNRRLFRSPNQIPPKPSKLSPSTSKSRNHPEQRASRAVDRRAAVKSCCGRGKCFLSMQRDPRKTRGIIVS